MFLDGNGIVPWLVTRLNSMHAGVALACHGDTLRVHDRIFPVTLKRARTYERCRGDVVTVERFDRKHPEVVNVGHDCVNRTGIGKPLVFEGVQGRGRYPV